MSVSIQSVEAFHLCVPLSRPLRLGQMQIPHREYVFVRITDSEGCIGTALGHARSAPVAAVVKRCVTPFWERESLEEHEQSYKKCVQANVCLGTNGLFWRALSLVDCAIFDLLSRRKKQPLGIFLGGQLRTVPTIIVGGYPTNNETSESLKNEMAHFAGYSPAGVKIASSGDLAKDGQRLAACREALPDKVPLMIDCYWSFQDAKQVLSEVKSWETLHMGWIEDPLQFDDYEGIRLLSEGISFPVAFGDEQCGERAFERLLGTGLKVLRLDATVCGGVRAFLKIASIAEARGVPVACHVFHPLHQQLAAVCPAVQWLETMLPESDIEAFQKIYPEHLQWENGGLQASPNQVGAGYEWDMEKVEKYRVK